MQRIRWVRVLLVAVLAFVFTTYVYFAWVFSNTILATPETSLAAMTASLNQQGILTLPRNHGLPEPEDFQLLLMDVTLSGWYFDNPAGEACGVILLHGRFQTRIEMLSYAPLFWDRDCDIIMYDARGHGDSSGEYATWGYYESQDALAVLDWFETRTGLRAHQIGMMGVSYGAATTLQAAVHEPDLAFAAADSSYASLQRLLTEQATLQYGEVMRYSFVGPAMWLAGLRADFRPGEVAPAAMIGQIESPVFLLHAREDTLLVPDHSTQIFINADADQTVLHITDWGAQHAGSILTAFDAYQMLMDDFLATYVPEFGK